MALIASLLICFNLFAHQSSLSSSGKELFWTNSIIPLSIESSTKDMSYDLSDLIIQNSMTQWNQTNSSIEIRSDSSSSNKIKFLSDFPYGSGVVGVTEINYKTSGEITNATILLNDKDFYFQGKPGIYGDSGVYLGDVVTHELGHFLGQSHSEVLDATMFYSSFSGQSTLSPDDIAGVRAKYGSDYGSDYGEISGYIRGGNSIGVLGASVFAISTRTGHAIASVSREDGYFEIGGLNLDDTYYLYTAPVKNPASLPDYFSSAQAEFCPSSYVGSFFSACGEENNGKPQGISLTYPNPKVHVGTVTINCHLKTDSDYNVQKLQSTFRPLWVYDSAFDSRYQKAFVGWFPTPSSSVWSNYDNLIVDLRNFSSDPGSQKFLKVNLISYSLGNHLEYQLTMKRNDVFLFTKGLSYSNLSKTYMPDISALIPIDSFAEENIFQILIRAKKLSSSTMAQTFPINDMFSRGVRQPYLLIISLWEKNDDTKEIISLKDTPSYFSDNEACLDAPFTYKVSQNSSSDVEIEESQMTPPATCGTTGPRGGGGGPSLLIVGMGFLLLNIISTLLKSRKIFLS